MRISDWSSDVCSSDLGQVFHTVVVEVAEIRDRRPEEGIRRQGDLLEAAGVIAVLSRAGYSAVRVQFEQVEGALFRAPVVVFVRAHRELPLGRASCRERVCQSVSIPVGAGYLKK